jgi:glucose/arabinose dehydrogenase
MRRLLILGLVLAGVATPPGFASAASLVPIAPEGLWGSEPIHLSAPPNDPRLFVVERSGAVRLVRDGKLQETPFLTVPNVDTAGERGLLSIAFPPDYASSGLFYVFSVAAAKDELDPSGAQGDLRVLEFRRSPSDPDLADPGYERLVLKQSHSADNHNGGQLAFGPDGYLYITIGDNANGANAQEQGNLFGKMLRIDPRDPEGVATYSIPPTNPFVGMPGAREEIWAFGLRNPYRASFAPDGGPLIVADVGQNSWEEINAGTLFGANLGWPGCEGACSNPLFVNPVFQYPHDGPEETSGCAIIGGYVVRDPALSGLTGRYLYGDLCRHDLRSIDLTVPGGDPKPTGLSLPEQSERPLRGFGEDSSGHVYAITDENVYRVMPGPQCFCGTTGTPDATAPGLELRATRQRLRGYVALTATCSEDCLLRAGGSLGCTGVGVTRRCVFPRGAADSRRASPPALGRASVSARAGEPVRLRLKVPKKLLRRARKALRTGRRVTAHIEARAADAAGNATGKTVGIPLVNARRGRPSGSA